MRELDYEDGGADRAADSIDNEYAFAAVRDPKVVITTSRDPSPRLAQFSKELKLIFPNSNRVNRGKLQIKELMESSRGSGVTDIVIVHEHRGEPDGLIVCHLPYGPTAHFSLSGCVLRHDVRDQDIENMSEAYPHLIFNQFESKLGSRLTDVLKYLFPVPKEDSKRVITFSNNNDFISFRHHVFKRDPSTTGAKSIELTEVGPRFELRLFKMQLGTLEMKDVQDEWVLRPFMNTASKRAAI